MKATFYIIQVNNSNIICNVLIHNEALTKVEVQVIIIIRKDLSDIEMNRPGITGKVNNNLSRELDDKCVYLQQQMTEFAPSLNPKQRIDFDIVVQRTEMN